tara:strand:- start:1455 stop:1571 length:117 start_codon:yes stop_codon:yes gene_type:complete
MFTHGQSFDAFQRYSGKDFLSKSRTANYKTLCLPVYLE